MAADGQGELGTGPSRPTAAGAARRRALRRLRPEALLAVQRIRRTLESLQDRELDPLAVKSAVQEVRQLEGALTIAGLHGPALLAAQARAALQSLLHDASDDPAAALAAVGIAVLWLAGWVDATDPDAPESPAVAVEVIAGLQAATGRAGASETDLFVRAQLDADALLAPPALPARTPGAASVVARKLLLPFQTLLLQWLKGQDAARTLPKLHKVAEQIARNAVTPATHTLWTACAAALDSLAQASPGAAEPPELKRALGRMGQQLKRLAEHGEAQGESETAEAAWRLLAGAAPLGTPGPYWRQLLDGLELASLLPLPSQLAAQRRRLTGPDAALRAQVAVEVNRELSRAKDVLDLAARGSGLDGNGLDAVREPLAQVAATLELLRHAPQAAALRAALAPAGLLGGDGVGADDARLLVLAGTLLDVELALQPVSPATMEGLTAAVRPHGGPHAGELARARAGLAGELRASLSRLKTGFDALMRGRGAVSADAGADASFDAAALLLQIAAGLELDGDPRDGVPVRQLAGLTPQLLRVASGQLAAPDALIDFAEAVARLELVLEALPDERPSDEGRLTTFADCTYRLALRLPAPAAAAGPGAGIATADGDATDGAASPDRATATAAPTAAGEDPEILAIFVDEAREVAATIAAELPKLLREAAAGGGEALPRIRRGFHTLKGSGRMVGAVVLGELAWSIEGLLNRCLDGTLPVNEAVQELVADALTVLPTLLAEVGTGAHGESREAAEALTAHARYLASGRAPEMVEADVSAIFREDADERIAALQHWLAAGLPRSELADAARALHTLKGSAGTVNAHALAEAASALEKLVDAVRAGGATPSEAVAELFAEAVPALAAAVAESGRAGAGEQLCHGDWPARAAALRAAVEADAGDDAGSRREAFSVAAFDGIHELESGLAAWAAQPAETVRGATLAMRATALAAGAAAQGAASLGVRLRRLADSLAEASAVGTAAEHSGVEAIAAQIEPLYAALDDFRLGGEPEPRDTLETPALVPLDLGALAEVAPSAVTDDGGTAETLAASGTLALPVPLDVAPRAFTTEPMVAEHGDVAVDEPETTDVAADVAVGAQVDEPNARDVVVAVGAVASETDADADAADTDTGGVLRLAVAADDQSTTAQAEPPSDRVATASETQSVEPIEAPASEGTRPADDEASSVTDPATEARAAAAGIDTEHEPDRAKEGDGAALLATLPPLSTELPDDAGGAPPTGTSTDDGSPESSGQTSATAIAPNAVATTNEAAVSTLVADPASSPWSTTATAATFDAELQEIFAHELADHAAALRHAVAPLRAGATRVLIATRHTLHTLTGSAHMAGQRAIAGIAGALLRELEACTGSPEALAAAADAIEQALPAFETAGAPDVLSSAAADADSDGDAERSASQAVPEHLATGAEGERAEASEALPSADPEPDASLPPAAVAAATAHAPEVSPPDAEPEDFVETDFARHATVEPQPTFALPPEFASRTEAAADDAAGVDADLAAIFAAEAAEILEAMDSALVDWRAAPSGTEPAQSLLRSLHTLKGGARLLGFMHLGSLAHEMESRVERFAQRGAAVPDAGDFDELRVRVGELERQHDALMRGHYGALLRAAAHEGGAESAAAASGASMPASVSEASLPQPSPDAETVGAEEARAPSFTAARAPIPTQAAPAVGTAPAWRESLFATAPEEAAGSAPRELARVGVEVLDGLLKQAGEVSIVRARVEQQNTALTAQLAEVSRTVLRLKDQLRQMDRETEAQIASRGIGGGAAAAAAHADFDPLELDRYTRMQEVSRSLSETVGDLVALHGTLDEMAEETSSLLRQQGRISSSIQQGLMESLMVPFARQVPRLERLVRTVAEQEGKPVRVVVEGGEAELDRNVLERITPALEHLLRNAVVHGVEGVAARQAAGKPGTATVTVAARREGAQLLLTVADDGKGLDFDAIRAAAVARGQLARDAAPADDELARFIFQHGFSTASKLTQNAGRGVGMDVVAAEIKTLGGTLELRSARGQGARFAIRLPLSLALSKALMVSVAGETYALPLTAIEGIVRLPADYADVAPDDDARRYAYAGRDYAVRFLADLVQQPRAATVGRSLPAVLVKQPPTVDGQERRTVLVVERLLGNQDVVSRSVGRLVSSVRGVTGATLLPGGEVVLILDVATLLEQRGPAESTETPAEAAERAATEAEAALTALEGGAKRILVVDDSVTMRRVAERVLTRQGYEVTTARDGVDAMTQLLTEAPHAILLDIEMPRADGFEVAAFVRNTPRIAATPIVMITSRSGDKHRARAAQLGVDRYLIKPWQEDRLLQELRELLAAREPVAA